MISRERTREHRRQKRAFAPGHDVMTSKRAHRDVRHSASTIANCWRGMPSSGCPSWMTEGHGGRLNPAASLGMSGQAGAGRCTCGPTIVRADVLQLKADPWTRPSLINAIRTGRAVELWGIVDFGLREESRSRRRRGHARCAGVNDNLIIRPRSRIMTMADGTKSEKQINLL